MVYIVMNNNFMVYVKVAVTGGLEITDLNRYFLSIGDLEYTVIKNKWIDAGLHESLLKAQLMVKEFRKKTQPCDSLQVKEK